MKDGLTLAQRRDDEPTLLQRWANLHFFLGMKYISLIIQHRIWRNTTNTELCAYFFDQTRYIHTCRNVNLQNSDVTFFITDVNRY